MTVAAPSVRGNGQLVVGNRNWSTQINGVTSDYFAAREWAIASGRDFSPAEVQGAGKAALLGQTVVDNLFGAGTDPIGQSVRISSVPFTVIGVLESKGQTGFGQDQDDAVYVPLETAKQRVLGGRRLSGSLVGSIMVKAETPEAVTDVETQINTLLRQRHHIRAGQAADFSTRNLSQFLQARANCRA